MEGRGFLLERLDRTLAKIEPRKERMQRSQSRGLPEKRIQRGMTKGWSRKDSLSLGSFNFISGHKLFFFFFFFNAGNLSSDLRHPVGVTQTVTACLSVLQRG